MGKERRATWSHSKENDGGLPIASQTDVVLAFGFKGGGKFLTSNSTIHKDKKTSNRGCVRISFTPKKIQFKSRGLSYNETVKREQVSSLPYGGVN